MTYPTWFTFFAAILWSGVATAQVTIEQAWVRGTVAQQRATGAFMQLKARGATALVAASSPLASTVEIHEMAMQNDVMRMRQVAAVTLPANQVVELRPGSYHIMLIGLRQQLTAGEQVPLTLEFQDTAGRRHSQQVMAEVRALNGSAAPAHR